MEDLDAIEAVEAACFPPAEAATNESLTARVATYPDHFWLLINTDADDDACFCECLSVIVIELIAVAVAFINMGNAIAARHLRALRDLHG